MSMAVFAEREMEASDKTALEAGMSVNEEKLRLGARAEQLTTREGPEVEQLLIDIYEKSVAPNFTLAQLLWMHGVALQLLCHSPCFWDTACSAPSVAMSCILVVAHDLHSR